LKAIWCTWDQPAMAAASVIQNMGRKIYVSGPDIEEESAYSIASNGLFVGTGSQQPYLQGVAQGLNIVLVLSGKTPPRYVQTPVLKVTRENLPSVWKVIFHEKLDQRIMDAYKK
jgi:ribose transport system substrate-binding protein